MIDLDAIRARLDAMKGDPIVVTFHPDTPDTTCTALAHAPTDLADLLVLLDEAVAQVNRLAFLIDQPSDGWIEWAERYRGGDSSLSSEAFYILRDTSNVWVTEARAFLARFSAPSPTDEEKT